MKPATCNPQPATIIVLRIPCDPTARAWYIWASRHGPHRGKPFHQFCRQSLENELRKIAADQVRTGGKIPQALAEYLAQPITWQTAKHS